MVDDRPNGRRFWDCDDVVEWIKVNVPDEDAPDGSEAAAVWWCCYRWTEALVDDTVKHIAQLLMDGVGPFYPDDVTQMVQIWGDDNGQEGDRPGIDDAIERDLRRFFIDGR